MQRWLTGTLWLVVMLAITAMSFTASGARRPAYGGVLRIPTDSPIHTLDPIGIRWPSEATLGALLYDSPYRLAANGHALPHLLRPVVSQGGGQTIRFQVRQHAVFHDGSPVRATHVIASLTRLAASKEHGWLLAMVEGAGSARSSRSSISGLKLVGTNTVLVRLNSARSLDLFLMALAAPQTGVASSARKAMKGVGTGPFVLRGTKGGDRRLRANRDYFDGPPYLNEVVLLGPISRDDHIRRFQLEQSDASLLGDSVYGEAPPAAVTLTEGPAAQLVYLVFNTSRGAARDLPLRRAVDLALDRRRLAGTSARPIGFPGSSRPTARDASRAKALIAGLGFTSSSRPLTLLVEEDDAFGVFLAPQIQRDLSAVGLPVNRVLASSAEARTRLAAGNWDMRLQTLAPVSPDAILQLGQILAFGGLRSEAARLVEKASLARREEVMRATKALASELPVIPLCARRARLHHRTNIRGASYDGIGRLSLADTWIRPPPSPGTR